MTAKVFKIKYGFPPKTNLCRSCRYAYGDIRRGLMCGITRNKPNFYAYCPYFSLSKARDRAVHSRDDIDTERKVYLLQLWTIAFLIILVLSPILDLIFVEDFWVFIITGFFIASAMLIKNRAFEVHGIPTMAYLYAIITKEIRNYKKRSTSEDDLIIYQTLVRLYGDETARKALKLAEIYPFNKTQIARILRLIPEPNRKFLFSLICQLFVYNNLDGCDEDWAIRKLAEIFKISDDEYFRLKQIFITKEYQYQSQQKQYQKQKKYSYSSKYKVKQYYQILGLSENASVDEIKRRFRQLAKKYHPDRYQDPEQAKIAQEHFRVILEAYNGLKSYLGFK